MSGLDLTLQNPHEQYLTGPGFRQGRAILGLTAGELAKLMGVTENTIYRKETGSTSIKLVDALALAHLTFIRLYND